MNSWRRIFFAVLAGIAALLSAGCSTSDVAGGGTDMPNGTVVAGLVRNADSTGSAGAEVVLRNTVVTADGDSVVREWSTTTAQNGSYGFAQIPAGHYCIYCQNAARTHSALGQFLAVDSTDDSVRIVLTLGRQLDLVGHLILPAGLTRDLDVSVFVPGVQHRGMVDSLGAYTLSAMPHGTYDIAFAITNTVNFTRVRIDAGEKQQFCLRDIEFALMPVMANAVYDEHECNLENSFYVSPKTYTGGSQPLQHGEPDTAGIEYFYRNPDTKTMCQWREDAPGWRAEYDTVLYGRLFSDSARATVLVTAEGDTLVLVGHKLDNLPATGEYILAAVEKLDEKSISRIKYYVIGLLTSDMPMGEEGSLLKEQVRILFPQEK